VELLFLVLALIYIWECTCWLPLGSLALVSWFGPKWKIVEPIVRNQKGGFAFAAPLPPLGNLLTCEASALLFSPQGIGFGRNAGTSPALVSFEEIKRVEVEGKKVRVNARLFAKTASSPSAFRIAEQIRELQKLKPAARETVIRKRIQEGFQTKAIKRRWADFSAQTVNLQILTNSLFLYLFVYAPLMIWRFGLPLTWPWLLGGLYLLTFSIAFIFHRVHKHFYPAAKDDRFMHVLINMFSPATTIRTRDVLSRPLLESFHPLAVAKVFCSEAEFRKLAQLILIEIRYPKKRNAAGVAVTDEPARREAGAPSQGSYEEAERFFNRLQNSAIEEFLKKSGLDAIQLLQGPKPADETCLSYCPRCHAQFTSSTGACGDCGGLELVPFPATEAKSAAAQRA